MHPEEVETVINRHPRVEMSRVRAKKNPITGSIVVADIVLKKTDRQALASGDGTTLKSEILSMCSTKLPRHKVPVTINIVPHCRLAPLASWPGMIFEWFSADSFGARPIAYRPGVRRS